MKFDIVTLFPDFFTSALASSMLGRAQIKGLLEVQLHDPRQWADDRHNTVDDTPYGGGGGMVMKAEPVLRLWAEKQLDKAHCIYLSADGRPLDQDLAIQLSLQPHLVLLCGHYRGIDERIRNSCIHREVSVGDYVLTGGEPAALVLIDAVSRLVPGVLGNFESALGDSFQEGLLDCPWYTRPEAVDNQRVPPVLLSGDHQKIQRWRRHQALRRTFERRPDLLQQAPLDEDEKRLISEWSKE